MGTDIRSNPNPTRVFIMGLVVLTHSLVPNTFSVLAQYENDPDLAGDRAVANIERPGVFAGNGSHSSNEEDDKVEGATPQKEINLERSFDRVICNFDVAAENTSDYKIFTINDLNVDYCTDVYYDYIALDTISVGRHAEIFDGIWPLDTFEPTPRYAALNDHKMNSPKIVTFLTIAEAKNDSGSSDDAGLVPMHGNASQPQEEEEEEEVPLTPPQPLTYKSLVEDLALLVAFSEKMVAILRLWGFDGLAIRWPMTLGHGPLETLLLTVRATYEEEVTKAWKRRRRRVTPLKLAVILDTNQGSWLKRYDMYSISKLVDHITLEAVEPSADPTTVTRLVRPLFRSPSASANKKTPGARGKRQAHNDPAPSLDPEKDILTIHEAVEAVVHTGVTRLKVNVAISLIGLAYDLKDPAHHGVGAEYSRLKDRPDGGQPGRIYFYETCQMTNVGTEARASSVDKSPYRFHGDSWYSYEDRDSIVQKMDYLRNRSIGGVAVFSQAWDDDSSGRFCGGQPFPVSALVYDESKLRPTLRVALPWQLYCSNNSAVGGEGDSWRGGGERWLYLFRVVLPPLLGTAYAFSSPYSPPFHFFLVV